MAGMRERILIKMLDYNGRYESTRQIINDLNIQSSEDDPKYREYRQTTRDLERDRLLEYHTDTVRVHNALTQQYKEDEINRRFGEWKVRITTEGIKEARIAREESARTGRAKARRKHLSKVEETALVEKQSGKCADCKVAFSSSLMPHFDHIKPLAKGGGNEIENFQALCPNCHDKKSRRERGER